MKIPISKVSLKKGFNPRKELDAAYVKRLAESLKSPIGTLQPVLIREGDNELIDGRHRIAAAKKVGQKSIECRIISASDFDAKILALAANAFGKPLTDLEIGEAVHNLLSTVKKGSRRREELKAQIAKQLGMNSTSSLEDCLTTYQGLYPEVRNQISTAVEKGTIKTEHLRRIRTLPEEKQLALARQIGEVQDPIRVDRLISGYMATQEPQTTVLHQEPRLVHTSEEPVQFFSVFKYDFKGHVKAVTENKLLAESKDASVNLLEQLEESIRVLQNKANPGDLVIVNLLLETPVAKKATEVT